MAEGRCAGCGALGEVAAACGCGRYFVSPGALARSAGDPALGRLVLDRFVLVHARAFGARATLYEALDTVQGDRCLVKVLRSEGDLAEPTRLVAREASLLALAPRAVVASARAYGATALTSADPALAPVGLSCLALEEARGQPLAAMDPPRRDWSTVGRALLLALGDLHAAGLVHGDLTPAHVFVDDVGAITLVDFGSAGRVGEPPDPADGATPAYAAPERGAGPTVRADLYAWGRVIERVAGPLDRRLAAAVRYATAAAPSARPSSAGELVRALAPL